MKLILFSVLLLFSFNFAQAEENTEEYYQDWASTYYVTKDTAKAGEYIKNLQANGTIARHKAVGAPIAAFLSVLFADNPDKLDSWLKSITLTGETKDTVEEALWISGNGNKIYSLFGDKKAYVEEKPINLQDIAVTSPVYIDMMWGVFSASGKEEYVKKIIAVLDENTKLSDNAETDKITRDAAKWSLQSNISQHEIVERIVKQEAGTSPQPVKQTLRDMLAQAHKGRKFFEKRSGDFSAMLAVTPEYVTANLGKYSNNEIKANILDKVKRGEKTAINVLFSGMELLPDLEADVSYDLKVTAPDGSIYDQLVFGNMKILKEKTARRFGTFYNRDVVVIKFEPKDKNGVYKISGIIKDNTGKKTIPLTAKVELVD